MRTYSVLSIQHKTKNTFCLRVERPDKILISGQCFNLGIPGLEINREYSMYSAADAPYLEFLIRVVEGGLLSKNLQSLEIGDRVELDGPYGEFCISPHKLSSKFVFIASGTGIAPFHSFVKTFPNLNYLLIHGIRYIEESYDASDYHAERYIPCISKNLNGPNMRVTDYIKKFPISKDSIIYLCGNRNMIIDSVEILLDQGIGGDQIVSEVFF